MSVTMPQLELLHSDDWRDYELVDSGQGARLERFGPHTFVRPEHQALWRPALPAARWQAADAVFTPTGGEEMGGRWQFRRPVPAAWPMAWGALRFQAQMSSSRHLGVFPEQAAHWAWMAARIRAAGRPVSVLNLFGYTGLATLACAAAGAQVTHVDASKKALTWARTNQSLSGLADRPVRWMLDDALKFVQREGRRQARYDGIVLDPPKFGRGPKGEVWECLDMLPGLLGALRAILSERPLFVVLTAYAIRCSALSMAGALAGMMEGIPGTVATGELVTVERSAGRVLSNALFARWQGGEAARS